ncbi:MAG: hypothetical protein ACOC44_09980 [Promethearchaeia archaeon]
MSLILLVLLFFRWFKPITAEKFQFNDDTIEIYQQQSGNFIDTTRSIVNGFKDLVHLKDLLISLVLFIVFLVGPVLYAAFGGNFLLL